MMLERLTGRSSSRDSPKRQTGLAAPAKPGGLPRQLGEQGCGRRRASFQTTSTSPVPEHAYAAAESWAVVVDAHGPQRVALHVQRLGVVCLRDAGVADQHVS